MIYDEYEKINILNDDLINHIWRMIYVENRVNNEIKSIDKFNSYIKQDIKKKDIKKKDIEKKDTKNSIKHDAKNNNKLDIELATGDDIKANIIDKQKLIKKRYKSLLETKKSIKNNIELINSALKKLPNESQPKLIELIRLDKF